MLYLRGSKQIIMLKSMELNKYIRILMYTLKPPSLSTCGGAQFPHYRLGVICIRIESESSVIADKNESPASLSAQSIFVTLF